MILISSISLYKNSLLIIEFIEEQRLEPWYLPIEE